jgi:hypothetical protein
MYDCKAVSAPVNPDLKLVAAENPKDVLNQQMYQAIVGTLQPRLGQTSHTQ